jgi:hypothetical protein
VSNSNELWIESFIELDGEWEWFIDWAFVEVLSSGMWETLIPECNETLWWEDYL